jgi:chaperonin GroES
VLSSQFFLNASGCPLLKSLILKAKFMNVVPLGDKIVVKRLEATTTTSGGIVLPDSAQEKPQQGRILSVGDGVLLPDGTRAKGQVSEGDRVLFSSYSGTEVSINDESLLIMREDDILAILN